MGWKPWGQRKPQLPFTVDQYELVRDLFINVAMDPESGRGTFDDEQACAIVSAFIEEGLWGFERLMTEPIRGGVEAKLAHDTARTIACETVKTADANQDWPALWIAERAADYVSLTVPVARLDKKYAVHRAERNILEATCSAFLSLAVLETLGDDEHADVEAIAQCIGLIWLQWLAWNRRLAFAAFNGEDLLP